MSFFFPGEISFPVDFICPHCDEQMPIVGGKVILCDCPKARLVEAAERERSRAHHRLIQQQPLQRQQRER